MWPFDIARKRREKELKELEEIQRRTEQEREKAYASLRSIGEKARADARYDSRSRPESRVSESQRSSSDDLLNPASPLSPIYHSAFYSSPSYDSCSSSSSSSSSSYDSSSPSSSESGSSSSSCD